MVGVVLKGKWRLCTDGRNWWFHSPIYKVDTVHLCCSKINDMAMLCSAMLVDVIAHEKLHPL